MGVEAFGYGELGGSAKLGSFIHNLDLEGIVAKRVSDPYAPDTDLVQNPEPVHSQKSGRAELFIRRMGHTD
jgi:hypothetical protein